MNWIKIDKNNIPEDGELVLAFFPKLSGRGLPFEAVVFKKGNVSYDRYLVDMPEHGVLSHYREATHFCRPKLPIETEMNYSMIKDKFSGSMNDVYCTSDPMGYKEGF